MLRLIKAFCGVGADASWGMFSSKITLPDRRRKPEKQILVKNGKKEGARQSILFPRKSF